MPDGAHDGARPRPGRRRRRSHSHDGIRAQPRGSGGTTRPSACARARGRLAEAPDEPAVAGERLLAGDLLLDDRTARGPARRGPTAARATRGRPARRRRPGGWCGAKPVGSSCSPSRSGTRSSIHAGPLPHAVAVTLGAHGCRAGAGASPARRACASANHQPPSSRRLVGSPAPRRKTPRTAPRGTGRDVRTTRTRPARRHGRRGGSPATWRSVMGAAGRSSERGGGAGRAAAARQGSAAPLNAAHT